MHRTVALGLSLLVGTALGAAGTQLFAPAAHAQIAGGFHAVSVATATIGGSTVAWFVGNNGDARYCTGAASCSPVRF